jgi:hypothetical protein
MVAQSDISGCIQQYSKESGPRRPGFDFTPEGWILPLDVQWNGGIMGIKSEIILILTSYLEN